MADSSDSSDDSSSIEALDLEGLVSAPKNKKQKIIVDFFKIKKKRGRPKKAKPKCGRPPSQPTVLG